MTFRQLALSNIRGSAQRYAAFFMSSVFSVLLFFLYAQFIFHPDVTGGYVYGGSGVRNGMIACEVLIIVFSFVFVLYSTSSFLRARHQEFGLLTLLGTSRAQLRKLIWLESTLLTTAAIGVGIALGLLFSKLFLMAMSRLLMVASPIRFAVLPEALLLTAAGFFVLFQAITVLAVVGVGRQRVIDLLSAARRPQEPPRASLVLAVLAALLVGGGYAMALTLPVPLAFFPVIALVTVGTYLLFGQASVFLLGALQKTPALVLRGSRLVVVAQLVFRLRDNARLLATIAILSAIVLTSAGTFYVMARQFAVAHAAAHPQALAAVEPGEAGQQAPDLADLDALLAAAGVEPTVRVDVAAVVLPYRFAGDADGVVRRAALIAERDYLDIIEQTKTELPTSPLAAGALRFVYPMSPQALINARSAEPVAVPDPTLLANGWFAPAGLEVTTAVDGVLLTPVSSSGPWLVANDEDFAAIEAAAPVADRVRLYALDWPDGPRTRALNEGVGALVSDARAPVHGRSLRRVVPDPPNARPDDVHRPVHLAALLHRRRQPDLLQAVHRAPRRPPALRVARAHRPHQR